MSPNSILRSTFLMLYLKEDNVETFFHVTRNRAPYLWTTYLSKCFPKQTVLNLGIVKS